MKATFLAANVGLLGVRGLGSILGVRPLRFYHSHSIHQGRSGKNSALTFGARSFYVGFSFKSRRSYFITSWEYVRLGFSEQGLQQGCKEVSEEVWSLIFTNHSIIGCMKGSSERFAGDYPYIGVEFWISR